MGGADAVVDKARASYDAGDLRWVVEVLNHVVFAEPDHAEARTILANAFEQLGFGSENGTWRNVYLSGATELRSGNFGTPTTPNAPDLVGALSPEMLFDALAIRVDGPRAWEEHLTIDTTIGDSTYRLLLRNGVLTYSSAPQPGPAELTLTMPRAALPALMSGASPDALATAGIEVDGDLGVLGRLLAVLDDADPDFAIVTPE
jgi:alkyl sulfatase BDS1-like metallo-beta-lactamase superfamily hydrolase